MSKKYIFGIYLQIIILLLSFSHIFSKRQQNIAVAIELFRIGDILPHSRSKSLFKSKLIKSHQCAFDIVSRIE